MKRVDLNDSKVMSLINSERTNSEIGRILHVTSERIRQIRNKLGVHVSTGYDRATALVEYLDVLSNREIMEAARCDYTTVQKLRRELEIAAPDKVAIKYADVDWSKSDVKIADELGIDRRLVGRYRHSRGIKSHPIGVRRSRPGKHTFVVKPPSP